MLALKRGPGEAIWVSGPCIISIVRMEYNEVKLGFVAPDSTIIMRTEIMTPEQLKQSKECYPHV